MKRLFIGGMLLAGVIAFAGTCTLQNQRLTKIGTHDTFAGEIHNDTGADFLQHKILVAFIDSTGTVLETKTVTPCLRSAQDGAFTFFSVASSEPAADTTIGLARFVFDSSLQVGTAETGDVTISNLAITRVNETTLRVRGSVKNNDSTTLDEPNVCAVVYTSDGDVLVVGQDTSIPSLSEDESDTFSINVTVLDSTSTVDHVDVYVDGLEDDVPIVPEKDLDNNVTVCNATSTATPVTNTATPTNTPTETNTPTDAEKTAIATIGTATSTKTPTATATNICG